MLFDNINTYPFLIEKCYVYGLYDPRNGNIFYIGKGKSKRMYSHVNNVKNGSCKNPILKGRINHILESGYSDVIYKKIIENISDDEALSYEMFLIAFYGKICDKTGILCNLTNGGDGGDTFTNNPNKEKLRGICRDNAIQRGFGGDTFSSRSNEEKKITVERLKKANSGENNAMYGKTHSEEARQKISCTHKGKHKPPMNEETKKKISDARKNWWNENLDDWKNGPQAESHRERQRKRFLGEGNPMYGHRYTDEEKKKMSENFSGEKNPMYGTHGYKEKWIQKYGIEKANEMMREVQLRKEKTKLERGTQKHKGNYQCWLENFKEKCRNRYKIKEQKEICQQQTKSSAIPMLEENKGHMN